MLVLVRFIGIVYVGRGVIFLLSPNTPKQLTAFWGQGRKLYIMAILNIVIGVILYLTAFQCRFTPLEKATDFNRWSLPLKADGGLKPPSAPLENNFLTGSAQAERVRSSLTGFTGVIDILSIVILISGISIFFLGVDRARRKLNWYYGNPLIARLMGFVSLAAGALFFYSASH
ncbi:MAG: hypothetical protein ISS45_09805 [Candidatus Omnitrophica bacterium]|nr:hypothetical protein [Candidatus Omnitrophota bacterium]